MVSGKIYDYVDTTAVPGDLYPKTMQLMWEVSTTDTYFINSVDDKELWHLDVSGETVTQIDIDPNGSWGGDGKSRLKSIRAAWHDRTNSIIYFVDSDYDGNKFYSWYLDYSGSISAPSITEHGDELPDDPINTIDIVRYGVNTYILASTDFELAMFKNAGAGIGAAIDTYGAAHYDGTTKIVIVGTYGYFISRTTQMEVMRFDFSIETFARRTTVAGTFTNLPEVYTGMSYDDSNVLYFTWITSSVYYLYSYNISGNAVTQESAFSLIVMLNRNTNTGNAAPFNLEKAVSTANRFIYQLPSNYLGSLYKIEDLTDAVADGTIVGITDTFLWIKRDDNSIEVWKYQDNSAKYAKIFVKNQLYMHNILSRLHSDQQINSDVVVEIFDSQATPELLFRGKLHKQLDFDGSREYTGAGLEKSDMDGSYTASHSAVDLATIVQAIFNDGSHTYADATSCPASGVTATLNFVNYTKKDALDVLRLLGNALWYIEPNGYGHFRVVGADVTTNCTDSGITSTQATGDLGPSPNVGRTWDPVNYVDIYGGINAATGQRFSSTAQDAAAILVDGEREWDGLQNFPCVESQAQLDLLSAAILAYNGVADTPTVAIFGLKEAKRVQAGMYMSLQFTPKTDLASAVDYPILKVLMDVKGDHAYPMLVGNDLTEEGLISG